MPARLISVGFRLYLRILCQSQSLVKQNKTNAKYFRRSIKNRSFLLAVKKLKIDASRRERPRSNTLDVHYLQLETLQTAEILLILLTFKIVLNDVQTFLAQFGDLHWPGCQYMGPRRKLEKRSKRGDPGVNRLDCIAIQHEIDYSRFKNLQGQWTADTRMIKAIDRLLARKP